MEIINSRRGRRGCEAVAETLGLVVDDHQVVAEGADDPFVDRHVADVAMVAEHGPAAVAVEKREVVGVTVVAFGREVERQDGGLLAGTMAQDGGHPAGEIDFGEVQVIGPDDVVGFEVEQRVQARAGTAHQRPGLAPEIFGVSP